MVLCILLIIYPDILWLLGKLCSSQVAVVVNSWFRTDTFFTYFQVQVAVAVNNWYRPFYDAIQNALSNESTTTAGDLYGYMFSFLILAMTYVLFSVLTSFFVSHYIFRWRTAMNDYYTERWKLVRHIEGASQRIQEDTMRFASIMKTLEFHCGRRDDINSLFTGFDPTF